MQKYIDEWASPNFHHAEYWPFLLLLLGLIAAFSWSRCPLRPRDLLLLLVSLYAGLSSMRMVPLFVLIAIPFVAKRLGNWPKSSSQQTPGVRGGVNGLILLAMLVFAAIHTTQVIQRQPQIEMEHFPARAVSFLQAHPAAGPLFNSYNWGGYLIWRLYPSTPVFIDGRADLYEKQILDQFADTYQFQDDWRQTLQHWDIGTILVPADSALATGLRGGRDWTVAYQDTQAVVLTRAAGANGTKIDPNIRTAPPAAKE
jgi:hypothetical protein